MRLRTWARDSRGSGWLTEISTGQRQVPTQEITVYNVEGQETPVEMDLIRVAGAGQVLVMVQMRDITDRKKLERQLQTYREELEIKVHERTREIEETKQYLENLLENANDVIYTLDTVFGFFPAAAFENQAGLPTTSEQRALFEAPSTQTWTLDGGRSSTGRARMARPMLLMLDRVTAFDPAGGHAGLGSARAEKDVDPSEWFFKAHFFQDPVQPGSLGIVALPSLMA